MKKIFAGIALCSWVSLGFAGTEVSHTRSRDETARAEYSWMDPDGCTSVQLTIMASKTKLKEDGITVLNGPSVSVFYTTSWVCNLPSSDQTFWQGTAEQAAFDIDSNLRSARVVGPVTLKGTRFKDGQQSDAGTKNVFVDVQWSSNDPLDKYAGTIVTRYPGHQEVNHLTGHYRIATATGSVTDGQKQLFPTQNPGILVQLYRLNQCESIVIKD